MNISQSCLYEYLRPEKTVRKYYFYLSVFLNNDKTENQESFSFKPAAKLDIEKEFQLLNL